LPNYKKIIVFLFFFLILVYVLWNTQSLLSLSYSEFIQHITDVLKNPPLKSRISKFFSEALFNKIISFKYLIYCLIILAFVPLFFLYQKIEFILDFLRVEFQKLHEKILIALRYERKYLVLIFFISFSYSVFYAFTYPMIMDEVWNFNYFVRNDFFLTQFIYNTGIIATHSALLLYNLGFSPDVSIRLPVLLFHVFTIPIYYVQWRDFSNKNNFHSFIAIFFVSSPALVLYTVWGRQYIYLIFAIFQLFILVHNIVKYSIDKRYSILFALVSGFGLYSSILFVFPLFVSVVFLLFQVRNDRTALIYLIQSILAILLISILLFALPVSIQFFKLENRNIAPDYYTFLSFIEYHYRYTGAPFNGYFYFMLIVVLSLFNCWYILKKKQETSLIWYFFINVQFLLPLLFYPLKITLAERLSMNTLIAECFIIFYFFKFYTIDFFKKIGYVFFVIFSLICIFRFEFFYEKKFGVRYAKAAEDISNFCLQHNIDTVFSNHAMIDPNLIYSFFKANKNIVIQNNLPESIYYKSQNIDSLKPKAITILKKNEITVPKHYKKVYENEVIKMFVRE